MQLGQRSAVPGAGAANARRRPVAAPHVAQSAAHCITTLGRGRRRVVRPVAAARPSSSGSGGAGINNINNAGSGRGAAAAAAAASATAAAAAPVTVAAPAPPPPQQSAAQPQQPQPQQPAAAAASFASFDADSPAHLTAAAEVSLEHEVGRLERLLASLEAAGSLKARVALLQEHPCHAQLRADSRCVCGTVYGLVLSCCCCYRPCFL